MRSGTEILWQQHTSQTRCCQLLCESVQNWCTAHTGFTQEEVLKMFEAKCTKLLDAARMKEKLLIKHVSMKLATQHQNWSGLLTIFWLKFLKRCATTYERHAQERDAAFVESQSAFADLLAELDKDMDGQDTSYKEVLRKISCAPSQEDLMKCSSEAVKHLDAMLQGYHYSHQQLIIFLQDRVSTLMSLHEKHKARICVILGIAPDWDETPLARNYQDEGGENGELMPTPVTQNGEDLTAVGMSAMPETQNPNAQLPNDSTCSVQYISLRELIPLLLSISLGQKPVNTPCTETSTLVHVATSDANNRDIKEFQSLHTNQAVDSLGQVDIWGMLTSEDQVMRVGFRAVCYVSYHSLWLHVYTAPMCR